MDQTIVSYGLDLDGVIAVEVPAASALIDAIAPLLHAPRVRILPTGQSWEVPFHALGAGTRALMDQTIVSYGLDLDTRGNVALARQVLIVSDPSEDLPMARLEADAVADRLRAAGWSIETRTGGAATRTAIAADLADAALLHYAGHGVHRGASGWGAALLLPGGDVLGVADILALPAVPQHVVLTGCETGYLSATPGGGMNLGRAFVFAGAEAAVVADVRVDDALARRVGESLYEDAASLDLTASLRNVQRRLRDEGTPEWEVFRVLTR